MSIHYDIQILRSKLIAMTRLTQRTVDYSIKAYQFGRPDLCRAAQSSREEMSAIRVWIANHGRAFLADRTQPDPDARFVGAALRISTALEVACYSAFNIARHTAIRVAEGWTPVSAELDEAGDFVYGMLRLCILSLLKRDARHAQAVLQNGGAGQSFDLAVYLAHHDLPQRISPYARFEMALVRCLDGIAGQVREIADALLHWHEGIEGREVAHHGTSCKITVFARDAGTDSVSQAAPGQALALVGTVPTRQAHRMNPSDDFSTPWPCLAPHPEDFGQARLTGLQQRVCELLVKNQQLRMALIAERSDSHYEPA